MQFLAPRFQHAHLKVAEDTYLIRQLTGEGEAPVSVYVNSLVILGKEPIIVDTGTKSNRKQWLQHVFSLVEPKDVKWVFLSHDDPDHTGNLLHCLEVCPDATLVTNWFTVERLATEYALPMTRMRWINDGDSFHVGDRALHAVARDHPDQVAGVIRMGDLVCDGAVVGCPDRMPGGGLYRVDDGVHFTHEGALVAGAWLADQIAALDLSRGAPAPR